MKWAPCLATLLVVLMVPTAEAATYTYSMTSPRYTVNGGTTYGPDCEETDTVNFGGTDFKPLEAVGAGGSLPATTVPIGTIDLRAGHRIHHRVTSADPSLFPCGTANELHYWQLQQFYNGTVAVSSATSLRFQWDNTLHASHPTAGPPGYAMQFCRLDVSVAGTVIATVTPSGFPCDVSYSFAPGIPYQFALFVVMDSHVDSPSSRSPAPASATTVLDITSTSTGGGTVANQYLATL